MQATMQRALRYIEQHLGDALPLEMVSREAACSRFHFHRLFKAQMGETLNRYIARRRLAVAAHRLVREPKCSVSDIALDSGYQSPEAFSRAFQAICGLSPARFRQQPDMQLFASSNGVSMPAETSINVEICTLPQLRLAVLDHQGPMSALMQTLQPFIQWRQQHGLSPAISRTFNLYYVDPDCVEPQDFCMGIGAQIHAAMPASDLALREEALPALTCARVVHKGSWQRMEHSVRALYEDWLPGSGYQPADYPLVVERLNLYPMTPEHELVSHIYLPLQA